MGKQVGLDCKAYYDSSGVGGSAWAEVKIVENVTLNLSHNEATIKTRESEWEKVLLGQKVASIDLPIKYDKGNAQWTALKSAFLNKTDIGIAIMSGTITVAGEEGLQLDCKVTDFPWDQPLEEGVTVNVTLRPSAESTTEPTWAVIV
jgi:hypothetical protein